MDEAIFQVGKRETLVAQDGQQIAVVIVGYEPPILAVKVIDSKSPQYGQVWNIKIEPIH